MAQFDVHRRAGGSTLIVDCQTDLLSHIESRFVVPLVAVADAPPPAWRLNPVLPFGGADYVMLTQAAAAVRRHDLGPAIANLAQHSIAVTGALDVLITGV
jgi:toxin CcdB